MVDMLMDEDPGAKEPADLVGISVRSTAQKEAYRLADLFRANKVPVILGGPHVSALPFEALEHADAVAVGEGELLWPVIVNDVDAHTLRSIYVCSPKPFDSQGKTVFQINSYPALESIAFPDRSISNRKYAFDTVFASRGCPIQCDFCSVPGMFGTNTRLRPADQVAKEVETLGKHFYLIDDTVFGRPATWDYYADLYRRISAHKIRRFWTGQVTLDAASHEKGREVIRAAANAGLVYAAAGIESVNPAVLVKSGAIRKSGARTAEEALNSIKENIRFIQSQGIVMSGWFVIGYDEDTIDAYNETWNFCREMNLIPAIFPVTAMPGTELFKRACLNNSLDSKGRLNPLKITVNEIMTSLNKIQKEAFSWPAILSRTSYYARMFRHDRIHRTIFALVLQKKMSAGLFRRDYGSEVSGKSGKTI
jgi:radical SAM superfamily enzyme YgiQ (UPF0313 family)